jgi:archaellum component FlaC
VLGQMKQIGERLDSALSKIDKDILTPETQADIRSSIANINTSIKRIDGTVERINRDFLTDKAREDLHGAVSNLNSALGRADRILEQAERGEGALHALLKDPKVAEDLRVFIHSLRQRGVLFYGEVDPDKEKERARRMPDYRSKPR